MSKTYVIDDSFAKVVSGEWSFDDWMAQAEEGPEVIITENEMTTIACENLDHAWRNVAWATVCEYVYPQCDWEDAWAAFAVRADSIDTTHCIAEWYVDCEGSGYWIMGFETNGKKYFT